MRCPKCYGKIDKTTNICTKCAFKMNKINNATNKKAKELYKNGDGDLVLQSSNLPIDISKKKLALFCGLIGMFGAHYFYIGKMFRGLINLVFSLFAFAFLVLRSFKVYATGAILYIEFFIMFVFVFVLINTIFDFINILLNRFKVPVGIEEE